MLHNSMIFWRKPSPECIDAQIEELYNTLLEFKKVDDLFSPNFILSNSRRKGVISFEWDISAFKKRMLAHPVNKGNVALGELGYSFAAISTQEESNCIGFSATIGNQHRAFYDSLVVNLPDALLERNNNEQIVQSLFKNASVSFKPFWGCITDVAMLRKCPELMSGNKPTSVHWVNYWSDTIVETIGDRTVRSVLSSNNITFDGNIFAICGHPIDISLNEDSLFVEKINRKLKL